MLKHRDFPSRQKGTDFQFTIRRESKDGATSLKERARFKDRKPVDKRADEAFLQALVEHFGEAPFERGNLDAGRLSWFLGREVVPTNPEKFDPNDYDAELKLDVDAIRKTFPQFVIDEE